MQYYFVDLIKNNCKSKWGNTWVSLRQFTGYYFNDILLSEKGKYATERLKPWKTFEDK